MSKEKRVYDFSISFTPERIEYFDGVFCVHDVSIEKLDRKRKYRHTNPSKYQKKKYVGVSKKENKKQHLGNKIITNEQRRGEETMAYY